MNLGLGRVMDAHTIYKNTMASGQAVTYPGLRFIITLIAFLSYSTYVSADYIWPVATPSWSNGFADYNKVNNNQKYHTGIDLAGARKTTGRGNPCLQVFSCR